MKKLIITLPLLLAMAACNQAAPTGDPAEITARSAEWNAAFNNQDIDAIAAIYTDDARLLAPNTPISTGTDAIRALFGSMIEAGLSVELTSIEATVSGDVAHHIGSYVLTAGDEIVDVGKYMESWERGSDGLWRMSNDIYNSDLPVPGVAGEPETHLMIAHEVDDVEHWLSAWSGPDGRRELFKANGAAHVHTFVSPENPNLTGLVIAVNDMSALGVMLDSEEGLAAAAADGVRMDTMVMMIEAE